MAFRPEPTPVSGGVQVAPGLFIPESLLAWQFSRSGGPGGQNVNKLSTKAELRIDVHALPISGRIRQRLRDLAGRRIVNVETVLDEAGVPREHGGELVIVSESQCSQTGNKAECLARLREMLVEAAAVPKVRRKTKPSRASKARRVDAKSRRGDIKKGRGRVED